MCKAFETCATMPKIGSNVSTFYKQSVQERISVVAASTALTVEDITYLAAGGGIATEQANNMSENVISTMALPLGMATNFIIDGREIFVPMATEEASVIAAASFGAKCARSGGGFTTSVGPSLVIGQIVLCKVPNIEKAAGIIEINKQELLDQANKSDPILVSLGGGARDIHVHIVQTSRGFMLAVHLIVDVKDAMGANIVNTMSECTAPLLERLTGGSARLRIVSNLATQRIAQAKAVWKKDIIGLQTAEKILDAVAFAQADIFRCATHNKGIMNGIDAVALATGNDWRAIEAGAHAYAALSGAYRPLTSYTINAEGNLEGCITLPLQVGICGGITHVHPMAKISLKILQVTTAAQLAGIMASVGLAQNFAALRALVCEGIQQGHMQLHSKKIANDKGNK